VQSVLQQTITMHLLIILLLLSPFINAQSFSTASHQVHITTPSKIKFHYLRTEENTLDNIPKLRPSARFGMNASMYTPNYKPVGLFIDKGTVVSKLKLVNNPKVNFGISQAVFYIDKQKRAGIIPAAKAKPADYYYAVQIAPMLVEGGKINPRIKNMLPQYRRNAFGITKDGKVVMLVTEEGVTMKELAEIMISKGCTDAAFVDGAVSEFWKPGRNTYQFFGVLVSAE
jgi:uncharacterized protein YigE (DUF2233 family)